MYRYLRLLSTPEWTAHTHGCLPPGLHDPSTTPYQTNACTLESARSDCASAKTLHFCSAAKQVDSAKNRENGPAVACRAVCAIRWCPGDPLA